MTFVNLNSDRRTQVIADLHGWKCEVSSSNPFQALMLWVRAKYHDNVAPVSFRNSTSK